MYRTLVYSVIIPFCVLFSYSLLSKIIPATEKPPIEKYDLELIRKKYRLLEILLYVSFFVITPFIVYLLAYFSNNLYLSLINKHLLLVEHTFATISSLTIFLMPSIFLGILIFGYLGDYFIRLIGIALYSNKEEYEVFYYDMNKRQTGGVALDQKKMTFGFTIIIVILSSVVYLLAFDNYYYITPKAIVYNRFLSLFKEDVYAFDDIDRILYITKYKNNVTQEIENSTPHYTVITKNNNQVNTLNQLNEHGLREKTIINYISSQTGIKITNGIHNIDD